MMKIYKITNKINKKVYVGKTTKTIKERFKQHIQKAKNGIKTHFYNAIRKYGEENFEIEIIEDGILNEDILNEKEKYWIKTLNSRIDGYNIAEGGNGGASIVPKHWSKQHHENYQKYLTKEVREKLSKKYSGEGNPMHGKIHSEESIQKMKDAFTSERLNEMSKKYSGEGNPMYGKTKEWCEQNKDSELAQKLINNNILQSERMEGKGNPMHGRNDQCYGARKWNESVKGKTAVEIYGEEWAKKRSQELSKIMKEKWKSEEYRKKKEITPEQRKKQSEKIKKFNEDNKCYCAYCKREFDPLNYKRWHGEKCKKYLI